MPEPSEPSGPSEPPGRWGTARPGRRDVLRGAAAVGAFLAVDLVAFLAANNWLGPARLAPQGFLDGFAQVFGRQPGFRKNHAKGVAVAGYFDSNGNGRALSNAAVFAPGRSPVIGRFSLAGGNPHAVDASSTARGLGLVFGFPGPQQWRMATLNLPVFLDNSPQGFYDRLIASAVVPGTGKPDPTAMARFMAAHPETARATKIVKQHPPTPGFADSVFSGLNAFYFVNDSGVRAPVRWSLTPLQQALPPSSGPNALAFDADGRCAVGSDTRRDTAVACRPSHRRRRVAHARLGCNRVERQCPRHQLRSDGAAAGYRAVRRPAAECTVGGVRRVLPASHRRDRKCIRRSGR